MSDNDVDISWIKDVLTKIQSSIEKLNDKFDANNIMLIRHDGCITNLEKDLGDKTKEIDDLKKEVAQHSEILLKMKTEAETQKRDAEQAEKQKETCYDKKITKMTWKISVVSVLIIIVTNWGDHIITLLKGIFTPHP